MNPLIIGCRTMENEILSAMAACEKKYDIVWIEAGLHNVKAKLFAALQKIIDTEKGHDRILFATGFCGNSILGLQSRDIPLVLPRVDDCTSLLFGGCKNKRPWLDSYFLTEGWLNGELNIWNEYQHAIAKYGAKRANRIFGALLGNYKRIALLDTGCYDVKVSLPKAQKIADTFSLDCQILPATTQYLEALLNGPWEDERFLTVAPHSCISAADLSRTY